MKKLALIFVGLILVVGCKSLTPVTSAAAIDTSLRPRMAQQMIASNALAFESLQWRGQAVLERGGKRQKISVSTRLKQDEGIWINGSVIVPLARIFITPKQLQGYEKINRQYAKIDFRTLKKMLGVPVDYQVLENLLTAKPVDARAFKRAKLSFAKNAYVFSLRKRGVEVQFVFDAEFRLTEQRLKEGKTTISVIYDAYKKIDGEWFPEQLSATLFGEKDATTLTFSARQVQLNGNVNMPFAIPEGYKSILVQ
ncbi:MAG: Uncharacterised protein [Bacteroidota bacterium]|nr:MAG: Uncharacterised protein [Bacteroidota bacterium]